MTRQGWIVALVFVTGLSAAGFGLLTAEEPVAIPRQRVSPKVLKEALAEHPGVIATAVAPHSTGRSVQDLRAIIDDLEKSGQKTEATRLKSIVAEIVRRAEHEMAEKKAQVARLNAEIDELKRVVTQ